MSLTENSNIIMDAGYIHNMDGIYRFMGDHQTQEGDWRVLEPFNIIFLGSPEVFGTIRELAKKDVKEAVSYIQNFGWCENITSSLINSLQSFNDISKCEESLKNLFGFPDYKNYAIQLHLNKDLSVLVDNGLWKTKTGWALSFYYKGNTLDCIAHSILGGKTEAKITEENKYLHISGKLYTECKYYRFLKMSHAITRAFELTTYTEKIAQPVHEESFFKTNVNYYAFELEADEISEKVYKIREKVLLCPY